jgi:hypothetical protein
VFVPEQRSLPLNSVRAQRTAFVLATNSDRRPSATAIGVRLGPIRVKCEILPAAPRLSALPGTSPDRPPSAHDQ